MTFQQKKKRLGMIQNLNSETGFASWLLNKVNGDVNRSMQMLDDDYYEQILNDSLIQNKMFAVIYLDDIQQHSQVEHRQDPLHS